MQTTHVGIREAKIHLSKYMKMVQEGNEIVLTDRGRPVGKIVPIRGEDIPLQTRIAKLEEKGMVTVLPKGYLKTLPEPIAVPDSIGQSFLQEDRNHD
jgi:prevent-host-death family protein